MTPEEISSDNGKKLDRIILLLEGEKDVPGALENISMLKETVYGVRGNQGLVGKVSIMWRAHVWVLCTLSGAVGFFINELAKHIPKP